MQVLPTCSAGKNVSLKIVLSAQIEDSSVKIAVAFRVGSPSSSPRLVRRTIQSFADCIQNHDLTFYVSFGTKVPGQPSEFLNIQEFPRFEFNVKVAEEVSWAKFINARLPELYGFDFVFICHDDIQLQSPNFMDLIWNSISTVREKVGWIGFTDTDYLNLRPILSVRPGFHRDFLANRRVDKLFQFHLLEDEWWFVPGNFGVSRLASVRERFGLQNPFLDVKSRERVVRNLDFDFPVAPVRVHSHFNHLLGIFPSALRKVGECEDWGSPNALLVDEDWSLEATRRSLVNIWIPSALYSHFRPKGGTRSQKQIDAHSARIHSEFRAKWGFGVVPSEREIDLIARSHGGTGLDWSIERNSFEWDYLTV